jgi:hypothetical protein
MIVSVSRVGKPICVVVVLLACLAPVARAGNTYIVDRARTEVAPGASPDVVRIAPDGAQTPLNLILGPGVGPLREPVGIDFDETTGLLLVTDDGGGLNYPGTIRYPGDNTEYPCGVKEFDCGALLSINPADPANAAATLLAGPSLPGQNLLSNPYGVLVRPQLGDALVADPGTASIVRVELKEGPEKGAQSFFNQIPPGGKYTGGLRAPWGLAEDPRNGDILVANAGVEPTTEGCTPDRNPPCEFDPKEFAPGFEVPADCLGNRGYILRLSSVGVPLKLYCDPDFRHPRNIVVNGDGTIFVVDPITEFAFNKSEGAQPTIGFGGVFTIDPNTGDTQLLSAGGAMATPSGIDFNSAATSLLIADERLFTPEAPFCPGGCGGTIDLNPDGGAQTIASQRGAFGNSYVDPIAIAVDHEHRLANLTVRTLPDFFKNIGRPEGKPTTTPRAVQKLPFFPVRGGSKIQILCVKGLCTRRPHGKRRPRLIKVDEVDEGVRKEEVTFYSHKHNPRPKAGSGNRYLAILSKRGFNGRFQLFTVHAVPGQNAEVVPLGEPGCLKPGKQAVRRKRPDKTVIACPPVK